MPGMERIVLLEMRETFPGGREQVSPLLDPDKEGDGNRRIHVPDVGGRAFKCRLYAFLEQSAISTHPTTGNKGTVIALVNSLHFGTTFWMLAFGMLDVWHVRCIQLVRI
jgi:hypothetical protein